MESYWVTPWSVCLSQIDYDEGVGMHEKTLRRRKKGDPRVDSVYDIYTYLFVCFLGEGAASE